MNPPIRESMQPTPSKDCSPEKLSAPTRRDDQVLTNYASALLPGFYHPVRH